MKNYAIFLISMFLSIGVLGQNKSTELLEVKVTPPAFSGIENVLLNEKIPATSNFNNYVMQNFEAPDNNKAYTIGTLVVQFVVNPSGELTDFEIVNSVDRRIDQEFIRVIKSSEGMWYPGNNNGNAVAMTKEVALSFNSEETEINFDKIAQRSFIKGSKQLLLQNKPKRALKKFDQGIMVNPYDQSLYYMRGLCRYELGQIEDARQDWMRLKSLGGIDVNPYFLAEDISHLKGYEELTSMFMEKQK